MRYLSLLALLGISICLQAQSPLKPDTLRVMFYNVENLFDCKDDTLKDDAEFLPKGAKKWSHYRYWKKQKAISRVIAAVGDRRMPALVGLCEVENDSVLSDLTKRSPLRTTGYDYVMTSSPDERGMDVALLYLPESFRLLSWREIRVNGLRRPTRNILHTSGILTTSDTLDVFVCHLPSRRGGIRQSAPSRKQAAHTLQLAIDSLLSIRSVPRIIIMGDFNDELKGAPLKETLHVVQPGEKYPQENDQFLLDLLGAEKDGSYFYQGKWELIDHLLVSPSLLNHENNIYTNASLAKIARFPFLLEHNPKYGLSQPFRTYLGGHYLGGYSDHLPIVTDIIIGVR